MSSRFVSLVYPQAGALPDSRDEAGQTPLYRALAMTHVDIVKLLLDGALRVDNACINLLCPLMDTQCMNLLYPLTNIQGIYLLYPLARG